MGEVALSKLEYHPFFITEGAGKKLLGLTLTFNARLGYTTGCGIAQQLVSNPPIVIHTQHGKNLAISQLVLIQCARHRAVQESTAARIIYEPASNPDPSQHEKFARLVDDMISAEILRLMLTACEVGHTYEVRRLFPSLREAHPQINRHTNMRTIEDVARMFAASETRGRRTKPNHHHGSCAQMLDEDTTVTEKKLDTED